MTETITPETIKPEQQAIIDALVNLQGDLSDGAFSKEVCYTASAWNKLKNGKFSEWKDLEAVFIKLETNLNTILRKRAAAARYGTQKFVLLTDFRAIMKGIDDCSAKPLSDPNRILFYLAPTGGGKSALTGHVLREVGNATALEARQSWTTSKFAALRDLCVAVGLGAKVEKVYLPDILEEILLKQLQTRNYTLVIDEGEYIGREVLNTIKLIVNKSKTVVLIEMIPSRYALIERYWPHEFSQIQRRTHAVVECLSITPDECSQFLREIPLNGSMKEATIELTKAANRFGKYDFICRVRQKLQQIKTPDLDDVKKIILNEKAAMRLEAE